MQNDPPSETYSRAIARHGAAGRREVLFDPEVDDARTLVVKADLAMYAAKQAENGTSLVYSDDMVPSGMYSGLS